MKDENELLQEAYELYQAQMPGACLAVCEEIKARPDHSAQAYYYAGLACISLGRINQAIAESKEAVRREPNDADFYSLLASAYSNTVFGRAPQERALRKVNLLRMETALEWQRQMTYGKLAETDGRWDRALACYRLALPEAPDPRFVQTNIGRVLNRLRRWEEARDVMRAVVSRPTEGPIPWLVLGRSEWNLGNQEAAADAFEHAAALDPYNRNVQFRLMQVSFARGQWRHGFRQIGALLRLLYRTVAEEEAAMKKSKPKKSQPKG